ncbi:hypothetical protein [Roseinatronobacter alkalisoli]|uniref:Uncharacterized protein n=1 Tax=Roseinatronobacter alkalisoli TaxID=3028235 RepID=A0ABT5TGG4_9RHOB|nr:hypothetical protein [Roseinatronobacter sp. HJB301]MDD7973441.1 hypothetical protein [Roseinatronobacter sp. HJB301]
MFADGLLTQDITYWATPASSPMLLKGRWSVSRRHLFTAGETEAFPQGSIISHPKLELGGLASLGAALDAPSLLEVPSLHWVAHSKYTTGFTGSVGLYRSDVKPVWTDFTESVDIFPVTKSDTGRSFNFARQAVPAYAGIASVKLVSDAVRNRYAGQFNQSWQVVVTLPRTATTEAINRADVEWGGKVIEIEGAALRDKSGNPLVLSWGGSLRDVV